MPKVVAQRLGVSMGKLAQLLDISYHTLSSWARHGSAPKTTVEWLEVAYPKAEKKMIDELAGAHPVDVARAIVGRPSLFTDPIPVERGALRRALGRPERKERGR